MTTDTITPTIEEGLRLARRLQRARLRRYGPVKGGPLALPELDGLHLPELLPTSPRHPIIERVHKPDFPGIDYYRPDGTVIDLPFPDNAHESIRLSGEHKIVARSTRYRHGVRLTVSTVFLPLNHNLWPAGPPILWETLIFHGGTDRNIGDAREGWRYAARDAALHGHRLIVHALDTAQARRKAARG